MADGPGGRRAGTATTRGHVLLVGDESPERLAIREHLMARGFQVGAVGGSTELDAAVRADPPDAAVLGDPPPDGDVLTVVRHLRALAPDLSIVILTAPASIEIAVRAVQAGADQFLTRPVPLPSLEVILLRLLECRRTSRIQALRRAREAATARDPFLGSSPAVRELAAAARRALATEGPVLILGESGAGKGALARWLHQEGPRSGYAFLDLPCAGLAGERLEAELFGRENGALPGAGGAAGGLLEAAHRGTVFLDEIGDLPPPAQATLLDLLEGGRFRRPGERHDRHVDVRLIAATARDLDALVRERRFREDLHRRIGVAPLRVPALRDRPEDIPALARRILADLAADLGRPETTLSPGAERELQQRRWTGNVRELRNLLERALIQQPGARIEARHLDAEGPRGGPDAEAERDLELTLEEVERRHIRRVLDASGGKVERAARRLAMPRSTLYQRLKVLGIRRET